jgi:hypothetical protein
VRYAPGPAAEHRASVTRRGLTPAQTMVTDSKRGVEMNTEKTRSKDQPAPMMAGKSPEVMYVDVGVIPISPIERVHMLDWGTILDELRSGKVAVIAVPADLADEAADFVRAKFNDDLYRAFLQCRYSAGRLYVWSSEHSPWNYLSPGLHVGADPRHPNDVTVILGD